MVCRHCVTPLAAISLLLRCLLEFYRQLQGKRVAAAAAEKESKNAKAPLPSHTIGCRKGKLFPTRILFDFTFINFGKIYLEFWFWQLEDLYWKRAGMACLECNGSLLDKLLHKIWRNLEVPALQVHQQWSVFWNCSLALPCTMLSCT